MSDKPHHTATVTVRVICSFDVLVVSDGQDVALGELAADAKSTVVDAINACTINDDRVALVPATAEAKARRVVAKLEL